MDASPAAPPAWEDGVTPFPTSWLNTWRTSLFEPRRFFRGVPADQPLARPLLYYLILNLISAGLLLGMSLLGFNLFEWMDPSGAIRAQVEWEGVLLFNFFFTPIWAVVALFLWALMVHPFVAMLIRDRRSFTATTRVLAYASGPLLFGLVPIVGSFVAWIWATVLSVIGVREVHRTTTGRAAAAVLLPYAIIFVLVTAVAVMIGFTLLAMFPDMGALE